MTKHIHDILKNREIPEQLRIELREFLNTYEAFMQNGQLDEFQHFRSLVENNYDLIFAYNSTGQVIYVSPRIERFGYTPEEIVGKDMSLFVHPEDLETVQSDFRLTMRTGKTFPTAFRMKNKDGSYTHVEEMSEAEWENGQIVRFNATLRDITERKLTEEALTEAERKYRSMFEHIIDVYFKTDKSGIMTIISPSGVRILGYPTAMDVLGINFPRTCFRRQEDWAEIIEFLEKHSKITNREIELRDNSGNTIQVEANLQAVYDNNARFVGVEGILRDITEKKATELARRESEERYRALVEQSHDAIFIYQKDRTVFANRQAFALTGFTERELYRKNLWELLHSEDRSVILDMALSKDKPNSRTKFEARIITKQGETRHIEFIAGDINYGGVASSLAVARDITERKDIETRLRAQEEKYRSLVESSAVGIAIARDHRIDFTNQALLDITGIDKPEDIRQRSMASLIHPHKRQSLKKLMQDFRERGEFPHFETELLRPDRKECFVEVACSGISLDGEEHVQCSFIDITERRLMERRITESEERNRAIVDASFDAIFIMDSENIVFANQKAEALTGIKLDQILKTKPSELFQADNDQLLGSNIRDIISGRQSSSVIEIDLMHGKTCEVALAKVTFDRKRHCLAFIRDITGRIKREMSLKQCEIRFNVLADLLPQTIFEMDMEGNLTFINDNGLSMFGLDKGDFEKGLNVRHVIVEDDLPRVAERMAKMLNGEVLESTSYRGIRKDGTQFPVLIYSLPVVREGLTVGIRGILLDNTEREQAVNELKLSRQRLELALRSANEAIWDWDMKTGSLTYNSVWFDLLGYEPDELESHYRTWESIVHPEDRPEFLDAVNNHLKGRTEQFQCEHRVRTKFGEWKTLLTHGKIIEWDEKGQPRRAIGTHVDLTEGKRLEEILLEAEKRALVGQLAGGVASELKNIMTSIEAYPDLILRSIEPNDEVSGFISRIKEAGTIGRNMISDLIHLSHEESPDLYTINLNDVLFDFIRSTTFKDIRDERPGIDIEFFPEQKLPPIQADQPRIIKCIENLIRNGIDNIPIEGTVKVKLGVDEARDFVFISVWDNGKKISKEDFAHMFEPFYQGKTQNHGGGLRLALVKSTVEDHGGYVEAGREKMGNLFKAFFPARHPKDQSGQSKGQ